MIIAVSPAGRPTTVVITSQYWLWAGLTCPSDTNCLSRYLGWAFRFAAGAEVRHRGPQPQQAQGARAGAHDRIRKTG